MEMEMEICDIKNLMLESEISQMDDKSKDQQNLYVKLENETLHATLYDTDHEVYKIVGCDILIYCKDEIIYSIGRVKRSNDEILKLTNRDSKYCRRKGIVVDENFDLSELYDD
jgi:hypothetical protein